MKLNYKNQKIKIFSLLLMLVGIVSLGFFVQGCTEDALDNSNDDMSISAKYLDLDITSTTLFTPEEITIIGQASYRIMTHMVFDSNSDKYVFDLKSPAEINVSERLFNYIYPGINMNATDIPRLKDYYECWSSSCGSTAQTQCYMDDAATRNYFQTMGNIYGWDSMSFAVGSAIAGSGIIGTTMAYTSIALGAQGLTLGAARDAYENTSNHTGATVTMTTTCIPGYASACITTFQYSFKKK